LWVAIVIVAAGIVYLKVSASQSSVRMETLQKVVGKRAIVCGGTKGIGKGFALELAKLGFKLSIVGRTGGEEVVEELNKLNGLKNDFFAADLSLVKEARRAARELLDRDNRLDVLVLSQGIGSFEGRTETSEHLDVKMSLHYYSRVAIANECASALETAQGSAVFILSPGAHSVYIPQDGDYELKYSYSVKRVAEACCWYTDLAIESLSLLHPHTRFVHAAPGFVASNWGTDMIVIKIVFIIFNIIIVFDTVVF
jgi:NAD(P)-dependent dehydrogenase (short-subunit alcohol dehydrogenase family)